MHTTVVADSSTSVHDAFISYSRKDTAFAAALERALKRYRPPKGLPGPRRRLNVFRDQEDFTGVEYSEAVGRHLRGARKLIVVCSPHARQSPYVNDEVRRFAESHPATDIVSVIIDGLPNNETAPEDAAAAFPAALCERLAVPLASDYRGFVPRRHHPGSRQFRGAWYKLLADLLDCGRAEVEERERRRRVRQWLVWGGTSVAISAVLALTLYTAGARGRTARSNELAGQAMSIVRSDPELAALLGLEALTQMDTPAAVSALRVALAQLPDLQLALAPGADLSSPRVIAFAPDGRRAAIADKRSSPRVVDLASHAVQDLGPSLPAPSAGVRWSPDGSLIAAVDTNGNTVVSDAATGKRVAETAGELYWRFAAGKSGVPAVIRRGRALRVVELERSGAWRTLNEVANAGGSLSPDGGRLATVDEDTRRVTVIDVESGQVISRVVDVRTGHELFWSPKGTYLVAHHMFSFVVLDARSLASVLSLDGGLSITVEDLAVSFDETRLAATDRGGSTTVWDITSKEKVVLSGQQARAYRPVFSSDGRFLSVIYSNGRAELFAADGSAYTPLTTFDTSAGAIIATAFTPDAHALAVQYEGGKLAFWSTGRWRPEHRLPLDYGDWEGLEKVGVTADGSVIAVQKGQARRGWSPVSATEAAGGDQPLQPLPLGAAKPSQLHRLSHEADVQSETISPDGACLLTASAYRMASGGPPPDANVVRLWDAGSATLLRQWHFGGLGPDAAVFAAQNRVVALYRGEGYVYRTELCEPSGVIRDLVVKRLSRGFTAEERSRYLGGAAPSAGVAVEPPQNTGEPRNSSEPPATPAPASSPPTSPERVERPSPPASTASPETKVRKVAPAFDCTRAATPVETLICADPDLATLDIELDRVYRAARAKLQGQERQKLVSEENAWIRARAGCAREPDMRACVRTAYQERLAVLRSIQ